MALNCPITTLQHLLKRLQDIAVKLKMPTKESTKPKGQNSILESMEDMVERIHKWLHDEHQIPSQQHEMYQRIENALQRQEGLNRALIKKQLQLKEYQKSLHEELNHQRTKKQQVQQELQQYSHQVHHHELEIKHLINERKTLSRESQRHKTSQKKERKASRDLHSPLMMKRSEGLQEETSTIGIRAHLRRRSDEQKRRSACQKKKKSTLANR